MLQNCKKNYGFSYIETPLLEETALFKKEVLEKSSDIVNKEMYQFIDKGENDVCLRPEGTAGVVRHFVEKNLIELVETINGIIMVQCLDMKDLKRKIKRISPIWLWSIWYWFSLWRCKYYYYDKRNSWIFGIGFFKTKFSWL